MKKNWIQALTLVLCAALLAAALWQGRRISELERTLSGVQEAVISNADSTSEQLYDLYSRFEAQRPLVSAFERAGVRVNAEERTLSIAVSAALALDEEAVEIRAYPPGLEYRSYRWSGTAVRDQEGRYTGTVDVPLDPDKALEFAAFFHEDGRERKVLLDRVDRMAELLPVQLNFAEGSIHYDEDLHLFYWIEWAFAFEDGSGDAAEAEDLTLRVYRNGALAEENAARKNENEEGHYWDGEETLRVSCVPGDRIEFRLAYGDGSGLRYETPIRWWEIGVGPYHAEEHMPEDAWPVLTWPE